MRRRVQGLCRAGAHAPSALSVWGSGSKSLVPPRGPGILGFATARALSRRRGDAADSETQAGRQRTPLGTRQEAARRPHRQVFPLVEEKFGQRRAISPDGKAGNFRGRRRLPSNLAALGQRASGEFAIPRRLVEARLGSRPPSHFATGTVIALPTSDQRSDARPNSAAG